MIKYNITFSTNHNGVEISEQKVKCLIIRLLDAAGIDGATLSRNLAGVWQGQMEDSYTLVILSDSNISVKVEALALNLKTSLKQASVMVEQTQTETKFV